MDPHMMQLLMSYMGGMRPPSITQPNGDQWGASTQMPMFASLAQGFNPADPKRGMGGLYGGLTPSVMNMPGGAGPNLTQLVRNFQGNNWLQNDAGSSGGILGGMGK